MPTSDVAHQPDVVQGEQRERLLASALAQLTPNHKRILEERFYEDRSYAEIATTLDVKLGTVMSRLSRAKDALIELLDPEFVASL